MEKIIVKDITGREVTFDRTYAFRVMDYINAVHDTDSKPRRFTIDFIDEPEMPDPMGVTECRR